MIELQQTTEKYQFFHLIAPMALYNYRTCQERFGSAYQIAKAVADGRLHKMDKGIYSNTGRESELEVLQFKYPDSVVTLGTAYYFYEMTDVVPDEYDFVTARSDGRIKDDRIRQYYVPAEVLKTGMVIRDFNGEKIRTYDLERLLIETARMKSSLPSDLYKEVILEFRRRAESMYPAKIGEYLAGFPKRELIERIIDEEVF